MPPVIPDHSAFVGMSVQIECLNPDGKPNGVFGATYIQQLPEGAKLLVSKNRQLTEIVFEYARIINITLA